MIAIIDYGMGNIHSVKKAVEYCGEKALVSNTPAQILSAKKVILPGVGAFEDAIAELEKQGLIPVIRRVIDSGKAFLGICLGMQLLFDSSAEAKKTKGLGVIKGAVEKIPSNRVKVPHIGWNQISIKTKDCRILEGVMEKSFVYFCHSYFVNPKDKSVVAASCAYGVNFASVVNIRNIYGVQFHPEKSQDVGLKIIDNFINLC